MKITSFSSLTKVGTVPSESVGVCRICRAVILA